MGKLDAEINVVLKIYNPYSEYTFVQVKVPYLGKYIEVKVPNNIQEGHRIRLKEMGYSDGFGNKGDLYIIISNIIYGEHKETSTAENKTQEKRVMQKMVVVEYDDFDEVNNYLKNGWIVKEFKPFKRDMYVNVYVLLEKEES